MHNIFFAVPILFLLAACGPKDSTPPEIVKTDEVLPNIVKKELTEEEVISNVRELYNETSAKLSAGTLKKDSLAYNCEDVMAEGQISFYSDAGGIVLVENSFGMGDHFGQTDHWYFKDGKLAFLLEETGAWRFGGPMTSDDAGNEMPGTIDEITENRYYFNDGALVKHLAKSYDLESWKDAVDPNSVPNETMAHNGETPESYNFIAAAMATRAVDCGLLDN